MNELCLDGAVLKGKKASGEEISTAMQQGPNGKSCDVNRFNLQCHYTSHVGNFMFLICSAKGLMVNLAMLTDLICNAIILAMLRISFILVCSQSNLE